MTTQHLRTALRPATTLDDEDLAAIWHRGWQDGHLGHVSAELLPHRRPAAFRRRVPALIAHTTVATVGSRVVGFVTVRQDEVEQLYVDASGRGSGAAQALLGFAERAIGVRHRKAWLAVVGGNSRARHFYARQGWADGGPVDYAAATPDGGTVVVPSRRYEKSLTLSAVVDS